MPSDEDAQIPTPDEIIGKGIDALVALRPRALAHINAGKGGYANIFTAWRAQAALALRRLSDHALQNRVGFSTGDSLRFLAASEYDAPAVLDPTVATGQATLSRAGGRDGGVIRKGARFARPADATHPLGYGKDAYIWSMFAAFGLFMSGMAGVLSVFASVPYMSGLWIYPHLFGVEIPLSSVLVFDVGVYLVVVGAISSIALALEERDRD